MKKYEINIYGYGAELALGQLTEAQVARTYVVMEENDVDSLEEFFQDDELTEEADVPLWHDNDEVYHGYGAYTDSTLEVMDVETGETIFKDTVRNLTNNIDVTNENFEVDDEGNSLFFAVSEDKGATFAGEIEIDGEFDISKLKLNVDEVSVEGEVYKIVTSVNYDDEEVDNDGLSTSGKSFEVTIYES